MNKLDVNSFIEQSDPRNGIPPANSQDIENIPEAIGKQTKSDPYHVKVTNMDVDKLSEAISSITSVTGPKGEKGDKGDAGKDGKNGTNGIDGKHGKDGKDGRNGKDGKKGAKGDSGKDGKDGKDGVTPVFGVDYFDGKDGKDGERGEKGERGFKGDRADYYLNAASADTLGGIKVGSGLSIDDNGVLTSSGGGGTSDHSALTNLDYASAGHTGFAPALGSDDNYVTDAEKVVIGNTSGTNTGDQVADGSTITGAGTVGDPFVAATGGSGDVTGPASAVDSNFASFDTTTGKLIKDSGSKASDFATSAQGALADSALQAEADTLQSVTDRGATTDNDITIDNGGLTNNNLNINGSTHSTIRSTSTDKLQIIHGGNTALDIASNGDTVVGGDLTADNLSGTNTGDQDASEVSVTDTADHFVGADVESVLAEIGETRRINGYDLTDSDSLPDLAFNPTTRVFSVSVKSGQSSFHFWSDDKKMVKTTTQSVTLPDTTDTYYIIFDTSGTLTSVTEDAVASDDFYEHAITGLVYYNATANIGLVGDERHGILMDARTHHYNHSTFGARYANGLAIEGLTVGGDTFTQVTSGTFWDEDIMHSVLAESTAPFIYRLGTTGEWTTTTATNAVGHNAGGTYDVWNEYTGTTWQLTEGGNTTDYFITFFIDTPDIDGNNLKKIISQNAYSSRNNARDAIESELAKLVLDGLPSPEFVFIGALIVKRDGLVQALSDGSLYLDLRAIKGTGTGTGSSTSTDAADVINVPAGDISATNVQDAINELDDEKQPLTTVLTNTTASYTTAEETKLAGIEALADVTDTTNVTAAGAAMLTGADFTGPVSIEDADSTGLNDLEINPTAKTSGSLIKALVNGTTYVDFGAGEASSLTGGRGYMFLTNPFADSGGSGIIFNTNTGTPKVGLFQLDSAGNMVFRNRGNSGSDIYFDSADQFNFRTGSGSSLVANLNASGNMYLAGKIDLGSTFDTSIERVSAGVVSIEGNNIITDATQIVKATGAEIDTGTDDAKFVTAKAIADSDIGGVYIGTITGATLGSTGNKAITGVGFTPKLVRFTIMTGTATTSSAIQSTGAMTPSSQFWAGSYASHSSAAQRKESSTSGCIGWMTGSATALTCSYVSMDSDGFTINVGTANSAFDVAYEAYA